MSRARPKREKEDEGYQPSLPTLILPIDSPQCCLLSGKRPPENFLQSNTRRNKKRKIENVKGLINSNNPLYYYIFLSE